MPTDRAESPGGCVKSSEDDGYADALVQDLVAVYDSCRGSRAAEGARPRELKAVAWARVSTEEQEDKGLSIPEQLRQIRAYADQRGIQIVQEFHEAASAFQHDGRRVQFRRMLAVVNSDPTVGLILVHDYSRFSRDNLKARLLIRDLREAGVRVVSLNDPPLDSETPAGVLLEAITFAKNEAYSREISFHSRKGSRANIQTRDPETGWCYKNGARPPWGYRPVTVHRRMKGGRPIPKRLWELDDTELEGKPIYEWVRYCLVELAGKGATVNEIASFCSQKGFPSKNGKWCPTVWLYRLLPRGLLVYSGFALWGTKRRQRHLTWPPDDWGIVENAHPAIITADEAAAIADVRRVLNANQRGLALDCPGLLATGMIKCSRCRRSFLLQGQYYVCASRRRWPGEGICATTPRYRFERTDAAAVSALHRIMRALLVRSTLLGTVNDELERAWSVQQGSAPTTQDHGLSSVPAVLGVDARLEATHPAGTLALEPTQAAVAGADAAAEWAAQPPEAPRVDARALRWCREQTETALAHGTIRERKYWVRAWVESAEIDVERHMLSMRYRLPHRATSPPGTGSWCARHSPTLAAALTRVLPVTPRAR